MLSRSLGREVPVLFNQRTTMRWISGLHDFWYRLTNGLVGGNILGSPILLLTTTGRKSGKRYTTPLLYLRDGEDLVIVASNNGSDRDPDWWRNLVASPRANAQIMGKHEDVIAHEATGEERSRLWAEITRRFPIYRVYERRTRREIPVVVLRTGGAAGTMTKCRDETRFVPAPEPGGVSGPTPRRRIHRPGSRGRRAYLWADVRESGDGLRR